MNLNLITPTLVLIILILGFGWLRSCEREKEILIQGNDKKFEQEVSLLKAGISRRDSAIATIRKNRTVDSLKYTARISALNASVGHWKKKASEVRPQVERLADSIPVLRAHLEATDSVIAVQDSVISVQRGHITAQARLYEIEIAAMGERHVQAMELVDVWKAAAVDRETNLKRSEKRKRFWRGVALITGGAVAALILEK